MLNASTTKAVFRVNAKPDFPIHTPTTLSNLAVSAIRVRVLRTATIVANVELKTAKKLARKKLLLTSFSKRKKIHSNNLFVFIPVAKEITKDRRANSTEKSWAWPSVHQ
jgi:hypothetical protein